MHAGVTLASSGRRAVLETPHDGSQAYVRHTTQTVVPTFLWIEVMATARAAVEPD
jgi:hypothetical protein